MIASMIPAFADDPVTYNITVNRDNDAVTHTYKVYQIFTGTPGTGDNAGKLTDVQYGSSYPGGLTGPVPEATLDAITTARAWAAANKDNLGTEVATLDGTTTTYAAVPGWYLVLDQLYWCNPAQHRRRRHHHLLRCWFSDGSGRCDSADHQAPHGCWRISSNCPTPQP